MRQGQTVLVACEEKEREQGFICFRTPLHNNIAIIFFYILEKILFIKKYVYILIYIYRFIVEYEK